MAYAKDTTVSPARSREELERTLKRYGADAFSYGTDGDRAVVAFRASGRMVRFEVQTPTVTHNRAGDRLAAGQATTATAKLERQRWRALLLVVKAKLESIESGIETFEEAFMAHFVLPDGTRFGEWAQPQIAAAYDTGQMPQLLPGGDR